MVSVNQTQTHCVNQTEKTHFKPSAARHGRGMAWARHGHGVLCVNRPFNSNWPSRTETSYVYLSKDGKLLVFKKVGVLYELFWNTIPLIKFSGGGGRDFPPPTKPSLRATLPTLQWISGLFPRNKAVGKWL
jgi:hypothetical protein